MNENFERRIMNERPRKGVVELASTGLMSIAAILLIVVAIRSLIGPSPPVPLPGPVELTGAILAGNPQARVAMIMYSDFECPYCGTFARDVAPALWREYVDSGRVLVAFRHLVLEGVHQNALRAAEASECADRAGQFWPMYDLLFRDQRNLGETSLAMKASAIGLDADSFEGCMKSIGPEGIRNDGREARKLGISGTPSFLFGVIEDGKRVRVDSRIVGARPFGDFQAVLRKVLAQ